MIPVGRGPVKTPFAALFPYGLFAGPSGAPFMTRNIPES